MSDIIFSGLRGFSLEHTRKKGVIGSLVVISVATVLIILILFIFIIFSGIVKTLGDVAGDTRVHEENETGIADVGDYMDSYHQILENRFSLYDGAEELNG